MPIDPSIALAVKSPTFNIQSPVDQFGQILSLRNLMQQQQMGGLDLQTKQLELQQMQQRIAEQKRIAQALAEEWGPVQQQETPGAAGPAAPLAPPNAPQLTAAALAPPQTTMPWQSGPMGIPGPTLSSLFTGAPAPAPGATQAPGALPQAAAQAPALGFSPNLYRRIIQENPLTGPGVVESMNKTIKSQYDLWHAQNGAQQDAAQREATLIQGIADEPTKFSAIAEMDREHIITPQERDRLLALPYNDPSFKTRANQALSRGDFLDQERKQIEEARNAEENRYKISQRPVQERKVGAEADTAEATALQNELTAGAQSFAGVNDPSQITRWLANVGPRAQQVYLRNFQNLPPNASLDDARNMVNGALKESVTKRAEIQAEQAKYQPVVNAVIRGDQPWENLSKSTQEAVEPLLIGQGFKGVAQPLSDDERNRLGAYDRALTILQDTKDKLKDPYTRSLMGFHSNFVTPLPWADDHKKLEAKLLLQQQELKKFISDGSIRGLTPETLSDIFPRVSTQSKVADSQLDDLQSTITKERDSYLRDLSGKAIPKAMQPPAALPDKTPTWPTAAASPDDKPLWTPRLNIVGQKPGESAPAAAPQTTPAAAAGPAPKEVQDAIKGQNKGPGIYHGNDGSTWRLNPDGSITPARK